MKMIVGTTLVICQLEGHELAFCETVQHRLLLEDNMDVLGSDSNCWVIPIRFLTMFKRQISDVQKRAIDHKT